MASVPGGAGQGDQAVTLFGQGAEADAACPFTKTAIGDVPMPHWLSVDNHSECCYF